MPRIKPTEAFLTDTRRAWEQASTNKDRKAVIDNARTPFGYSYSNMTRKLKLKARTRSLSPEQAERASELEHFARVVYNFKAKAEFEGTFFSVQIAYESLRDNGQIPDTITLSMIRRKAEEIGLVNEYASPARKFTGRTAPLHLVMVDYSKSEYFHYKDNGQIYMMKAVVTKKEYPRLYIGAAIDQYSRVAWVKYYMVKGENPEFVRTVFLDAFEEKPDCNRTTSEISGHRRLLQGIPRELYFDRGPGNTSKETASGLLKLNIKKITGSVEIDVKGRKTVRSNKKGRGMIEKFIRDFKDRFEARLWARKLLGDLPPDFTLMELNEWAEEYCEEVNCKFHPILTDEVRWTLFEPALSEAVFPPDEAKMYFDGGLTRRVQHRLVQGKKGHWFIVPEKIGDGEMIEILLSGRDCYMFYEGTVVKLRPQQGSVRDAMESESGCEMYEGMQLRERFGNEILHSSAGEFKIPTLSESLKDDVLEFLGRPRSVDEVKEKASYFIMVSKQERKMPKIIHYSSV